MCFSFYKTAYMGVMRQFRKKVAVMAAAGIFAASLLAGCSSMNNDAIVAEVGKDHISLGVANFYARMQQAQYESYYAGAMGTTGKDMWTQDVGGGKTYEENTKKSILTSLENMYLLKQHAGDYKVTLNKDDEKAIDKASEHFEQDNTLEDKKVVSGYKKYVRTFLKLATIQNKMDQPLKAGVKEDVSDEESAQKSMQYVLFPYNKTDKAGKAKAMSDEEKAGQQKKAGEFADKLKDSSNHDIEAAAAEAGLQVQTASFDSKSQSPSKELVKAADVLANEGDVTGAVETSGGIYIAKLNKKLDREATDAKKKAIVEERKQKQYDSQIKKWRKETKITEHKRVWKKINFEKQGVSVKQSADKYSDVGSGKK